MIDSARVILLALPRAFSKIGGSWRGTALFDIELNDARQIVLVRFRGELSERDFADLDAIGGTMKAADQFDCIFDLSAVEKVELATEFISKRGELPQVFTDRHRIYVVPQEDIKLLVRLYAAYQSAKGWRPPVIVEKIEDAFEMLGVAASDFQAPGAAVVTQPA
jgi:hypothetical protein